MDERMPPRAKLGQHYTSSLGQLLLQRAEHQQNPDAINPTGLRTVMGYPLPRWQRPLVWTETMSIRFMESVWLGLPLGTYTYNQTVRASPLDGLLIDGQQRLYAIEQYLEDQFPVFGYRWSEVTPVDRRMFKTITFGNYVTTSEDEDYLKRYYDIMNFGGVRHTEDQRALA